MTTLDSLLQLRPLPNQKLSQYLERAIIELIRIIPLIFITVL